MRKKVRRKSSLTPRPNKKTKARTPRKKKKPKSARSYNNNKKKNNKNINDDNNNKKKENGNLSLLDVVSAYNENDEETAEAIYAKQMALYKRRFSVDDTKTIEKKENNNVKPTYIRRRSNSLISLSETASPKLESKSDLFASMYEPPNMISLANDDDHSLPLVIKLQKIKKLQRQLILNKLSIDTNGCRILGDFLFANQNTISVLDLSYNQINFDGIQILSNIFKYDNKLCELRLGFNKLGYRGAEIVADLIEQNQNLRIIDLRNNQMGDPGCVSIAHAIINHSSLESLNLINNDITYIGAKAIAESLKSNSSLIQLYIGHNLLIGDEGGANIIRVIKSGSTSIQELSMCDTGLGYRSAVQIADLLDRNTKPLSSLYVEGNYLGEDGVTILAKSLRHNSSLLELNIGLNQMNSAGEALLILADSLRWNQALRHLTINGVIDLSGFKDPNAISLDFRNHKLEGEDIVIIAALLLDNTTVMELDLRDNNLGRKGTIALAETLKLNDTLEILWLNERLMVKEVKELMKLKSIFELEEHLSLSRFGFEEVLLITTLADYYGVTLPPNLQCFNQRDIERVDSGFAVLEALVANPNLSLITLAKGENNQKINDNKIHFKARKHRTRAYVMGIIMFIEIIQFIGFIAFIDNDSEWQTYEWISKLLAIFQWTHFYHSSIEYTTRFYIILSIIILFLLSFLPIYISLIPKQPRSRQMNNNQVYEAQADDMERAKQNRVKRTLTMALTPAYLTRPPSIDPNHSSKSGLFYAWDVVAHRVYSKNSILFFIIYLHCLLCCTIYFIPIVRTLIDSAQCEYDSSIDDDVLFIDASIICWSERHYKFLISSIILLVFYLFFTCRLVLVGGSIDCTFYAPTARGFSWLNWSRDLADVDNRDIISARHYRWMLYVFIMKLCFIFFSSHWSIDYWGDFTMIIVMTSLSSILMLIFILTQPFYMRRMNWLMVYTCLMIFWIYLCIIFLSILDTANINQKIIAIITFVLAPCILIISFLTHWYIDEKRWTPQNQHLEYVSPATSPTTSPRHFRRQLSLSERVDKMLSEADRRFRFTSDDSRTSLVTSDKENKNQIYSLQDLRRRAELELRRAVVNDEVIDDPDRSFSIAPSLGPQMTN